MQSSPPTRAWARPATPTGSQYSFDLAALDGRSRSGATSPELPAQHVDRVLSEDIDGPSDFTQNLEAWMRGGTLNRNGTIPRDLQSLREMDEAGHNAETQSAQGQHGGEDHTVSHHTPSNSPPRESVFATSRHDEGAQQDSSAWNPYAEGATPQPPAHQQFLQPTVEDYFSELTPTQPLSLRASRSASRRKSSVLIAETHYDQSQPSTPGRPSSETISPVRSPVLQRAAPRHFSSQSAESSFERQMQELREKCQRLEHLNSALSVAIEEERRLRKQEREMLDSKLADATRRESQLTEMKNQAYEHKEDFRREFGELKDKAQRQERELEQLRLNGNVHLEQHQKQAEQERRDHIQEIRALEQDLELARRSRDDAEEMARIARDDLEEYRAARDPGTHEAESMADQIADLREQLRAMIAENEELKLAKNNAEQTVHNLRSEIALLKQTQQEDTSRLASDHRRAVTLAENLQWQLKELREQTRTQKPSTNPRGEQQAANFNAPAAAQGNPDESLLTTIREELTQSQTKLNSALCELDAKQADINIAVLERDAAQDELAGMTERYEAVKARLTEKDDVNKEDDRSAEWEKRETEYREEIRVLQAERRTLVNECLRMWGREECGPADESKGERQKYRYKFRNRDGTLKPEWVMTENGPVPKEKPATGNECGVLGEIALNRNAGSKTEVSQSEVTKTDMSRILDVKIDLPAVGATERRFDIAAYERRRAADDAMLKAAMEKYGPLRSMPVKTAPKVAPFIEDEQTENVPVVASSSRITLKLPADPPLKTGRAQRPLPKSIPSKATATWAMPANYVPKKIVPLRTALLKAEAERKAAGGGDGFDLAYLHDFHKH